MSNFSQSGNRYTAIFLERTDGALIRLEFDIVRFNVDENPEAVRALVPRGNDTGKVFEKVWITKQIPWRKKVGFGELY